MDDSKLSLYLDGRLPEEAARELEARVRKEAPLRRRLDELRALQSLAASLPLAAGRFEADDIREMAAGRRASAARRRRLVASIAAVLVLAVSHGASYWLGANRGAKGVETPTAADPLERAEEILEGLARVDPAAPHDRLQAQLIDYRKWASQDHLQPQRIAGRGRSDIAAVRRVDTVTWPAWSPNARHRQRQRSTHRRRFLHVVRVYPSDNHHPNR